MGGAGDSADFKLPSCRLRRDASMSALDPADSMETAEEQRVHSPPASLVPRLHVLHARRLPHNNPLLPEGGAAGE